jgi:predicted DNA-binding transcriptional regulator AlpA
MGQPFCEGGYTCALYQPTRPQYIFVSDDSRFLSAARLMERYGVSAMWLVRRMADSNFPKPIRFTTPRWLADSGALPMSSSGNASVSMSLAVANGRDAMPPISEPYGVRDASGISLRAYSGPAPA